MAFGGPACPRSPFGAARRTSRHQLDDRVGHRVGRVTAYEPGAGVADDGRGMSADVRSRIFEPFFSTKSDGGGSGLGLCIAQRIVLRHGGRIAVASEPEKGTTFTVTLPLRPPF